MLASWLGLQDHTILNQAVDELKRQLAIKGSQIDKLHLEVTHLRVVVQNLAEEVQELEKELDNTDEHCVHIADTVNNNFAKCRKKFNKLALHLNLPSMCENAKGHTWIVDLAPSDHPEEFCTKCGVYKKSVPDPAPDHVPASTTIEASENFKTTDRSPLVD